MRRILLQRPVIATLTILVLLLTYWGWGVVAARGKFEPPAYFASSEKVNVEVVLRFPPETFHMLILQDAGRVIRVEGKSVFIRDASVHALHALARRPWVTDVKAWNG